MTIKYGRLGTDEFNNAQQEVNGSVCKDTLILNTRTSYIISLYVSLRDLVWSLREVRETVYAWTWLTHTSIIEISSL